MFRKKILVLEKINFEESYLLKKIKNIRIEYFDENKKLNLDHEIIFCRLKYKLDKKFLNKFKKLRYICTPTTGLNHIDIKYCYAKKIEIIKLNSANKDIKKITSTSEYSFALILSLIRNIPQSYKYLLNNKNWNRNFFLSKDFSEITVGVVGFGRIGQNLVKLLKLVNINIIINDIKISPSLKKKYNLKIRSLSYLLKNSDIVSLHINYSEKNKNFVNSDFLKKMKKNSILINTSRGELINEKDLLSHLKINKNFFVALDVLSNETINGIHKNKILNNLNNINAVLTPHLGGATVKSIKIAEKYIIDNLHKVLVND
jgi:D-3-phosphoglycerate dehydrogenase